MMIDNILMEMESIVIEANALKEQTLEALVLQGIISKDQKEEFCQKFHFIIVKEKWYKRLFGDGDKYIFKLVQF